MFKTNDGSFAVKLPNGWTISISTWWVPPAYKQGVDEGWNSRAVDVLAFKDEKEHHVGIIYPDELAATLNTVSGWE